jgi:uncharacterized membrane protein YeaQ/YmgE (transglycosylase-associated protein family)
MVGAIIVGAIIGWFIGLGVDRRSSIHIIRNSLVGLMLGAVIAAVAYAVLGGAVK